MPEQTSILAQNSETLLRLFIKQAPVAVAMFDAQMRYLIVSQRWLDAYHLQEADIIGQSHYDVFPNMDESWKEVHQRCLQGTTEKRDEDPFPHADGSLEWLRWEIYPWYAEDNSVGGLVIVNEFITEQKKLALMQEKRAVELETVTRVSQAVANIVDLDELLQTVADLTKSSFELYHTHVYLLDATQTQLQLFAGAGDIGRKMLAQGWRILVNAANSLVAQAARDRQPHHLNDVKASPNFLPNPLLPHTRAEVAVPIIRGDMLLGVLDVQSDKLNYFSSEEVRIYETLAQTISGAIQNAYLYRDMSQRAERERTLRELNERLQTSYSVENVLQAATEEVGRILNKNTAINLNTPNGQ